MLQELKSIHPLIQFLIYLLVGAVTMAALAMLATLVYFLAGESTPDLSNASALESTFSINFLKWLQILQSIGLFILPFMLYHRVHKGAVSYPIIGNHKPFLFLAVFSLAMLCAYPAINALAAFNQSISLPDALGGIEAWMHQKESEAETLIKAFLVMDDLTDLGFNLLVIAILPAIGEELFFRGMMQSLLQKWLKKPHLSIWIVAIVFSAIHMQFLGFIPRMILGGVLGYAAWYSGSLIVPIAGHFVNNGLAVILAFIYGAEAMDSEADVLGSDPTDWLIVLLSAAILMVGVVLMKRFSAFSSRSISSHEMNP